MATTQTTPITNDTDILDSRDIIARIEALENEREALVEARDEAYMDLSDEHHTAAVADREAVLRETTEALTDWDTDHMPELAALIDLAKEGADYAADWAYGEALIRDSYFETYAQELAEDIAGKAISHAQWPMNCIDWAQAAQELQHDYSAVDFAGVRYWIR